VPKRRVAQVVGETDGLDEIAVDVEIVAHRPPGPEVLADRAADLRHLHRVRETCTVKIVFAERKTCVFDCSLRKACEWMMRSRSIWNGVR